MIRKIGLSIIVTIAISGCAVSSNKVELPKKQNYDSQDFCYFNQKIMNEKGNTNTPVKLGLWDHLSNDCFSTDVRLKNTYLTKVGPLLEIPENVDGHLWAQEPYYFSNFNIISFFYWNFEREASDEGSYWSNFREVKANFRTIERDLYRKKLIQGLLTVDSEAVKTYNEKLKSFSATVVEIDAKAIPDVTWKLCVKKTQSSYETEIENRRREWMKEYIDYYVPANLSTFEKDMAVNKAWLTGGGNKILNPIIDKYNKKRQECKNDYYEEKKIVDQLKAQKVFLDKAIAEKNLNRTESIKNEIILLASKNIPTSSQDFINKSIQKYIASKLNNAQ